MIDEIKRFVKVVEIGSLTKASQELFITQPALSASILRLEQELKIKLFKRSGRRLTLTVDGKDIYQICQGILKLWEIAKDQERRKLSRIPLINIGVYDNAALKLSNYFQKCLESNTTKFEITIDRSATILQGLQNGLLDIGVCVLPTQLYLSSEVVLIKKFKEKLIPVSAKRWARVSEKLPFIVYNKQSSTRYFIDQAFLRGGFSPNIIVESTDPGFMKQLAIAKAGIAFLPENFVKDELKQKKLFIQKLPFNIYRELGLFLHKESFIKESDQIIEDIQENLQ